MIRFWAAVLILSAAMGHSSLVNSIVANVGNYAITDYDLKMMQEFNLASGIPSTNAVNDSFNELILTYGLLTLSDSQEKLKIPQAEIDSFINSITNVANTDPATEMRLKLYREFPEQFNLQLKKNRILQNLMFLDPDLKQKVNQPVSDSEMRAFYDKNKPAFVEYPIIDFGVIVVLKPANFSSLEKQEAFENTIKSIVTAVSNNFDFDTIISKFKNKIKIEPYSGRSGMKKADELYRQGIYPDIVFNIATAERIPISRDGFLIMKPGAIFGGAQYQQLDTKGTQGILILKLYDKKPGKQFTFEEVKPNIESRLREIRMRDTVRKYIADKIEKGDISVSLVDKSWEGVYNEFIRR